MILKNRVSCVLVENDSYYAVNLNYPHDAPNPTEISLKMRKKQSLLEFCEELEKKIDIEYISFRFEGHCLPLDVKLDELMEIEEKPISIHIGDVAMLLNRKVYVFANYDSLKWRGNLCFKLKEWNEAIQRFQMAIEHFPNCVHARNNLALCYMKTNRPKQTIHYSEEILKILQGEKSLYEDEIKDEESRKYLIARNFQRKATMYYRLGMFYFSSLDVKMPTVSRSFQLDLEQDHEIISLEEIKLEKSRLQKVESGKQGKNSSMGEEMEMVSLALSLLRKSHEMFGNIPPDDDGKKKKKRMNRGYQEIETIINTFVHLKQIPPACPYCHSTDNEIKFVNLIDRDILCDLHEKQEQNLSESQKKELEKTIKNVMPLYCHVCLERIKEIEQQFFKEVWLEFWIGNKFESGWFLEKKFLYEYFLFCTLKGALGMNFSILSKKISRDVKSSIFLSIRKLRKVWLKELNIETMKKPPVFYIFVEPANSPWWKMFDCSFAYFVDPKKTDFIMSKIGPLFVLCPLQQIDENSKVLWEGGFCFERGSDSLVISPTSDRKFPRILEEYLRKNWGKFQKKKPRRRAKVRRPSGKQSIDP